MKIRQASKLVGTDVIHVSVLVSPTHSKFLRTDSKRSLALNTYRNDSKWQCVWYNSYRGSPTHRILVSEAFFTKVRGRRRMPDALDRVGWSLVVSLGEMVRPRFQVNRGHLMEGFTRHPGCVAQSERRMKWTINHWSPLSYVTVRSFDHVLGVESLK